MSDHSLSLFEPIGGIRYPIIIVPDVPRNTFISPDKLERVLGLPRGSGPYNLALLWLCERFLIDTVKNGDPKMTRRERQGLRILTDEDCAAYTPSLVCQHLNSAVRAGRRGVTVVRRDHLEDRQREQWDRFCGKWSQMGQALKAVEKEIESIGLCSPHALEELPEPSQEESEDDPPELPR